MELRTEIRAVVLNVKPFSQNVCRAGLQKLDWNPRPCSQRGENIKPWWILKRRKKLGIESAEGHLGRNLGNNLKRKTKFWDESAVFTKLSLPNNKFMFIT